ncbi:MAG: fructose-6-phosphate aldolase [Clostridia bacterium]|nr:fructose-6-phosphate aldolase [Clostridia bacterium]
MELFVDTADLDAVRKVNDYFPIEGFTTNPNILTKAPKPLSALFAEYRAYVRETGQKIFVQVTETNAEDMLSQARRLGDFFGDSLVVKLPATAEGYRACKLCKREGFKVCVTVIHSMMQAFTAAKAGADYAAPYVTHIDNIGADGVRCVDEMVRVFQRFGYPCKVLGASFRTVDQLERLAVVGCHAVTITPEMFRAMIAHPSTDVSLQGFDAAWRNAFGSSQVTDFLPADL